MRAAAAAKDTHFLECHHFLSGSEKWALKIPVSSGLIYVLRLNMLKLYFICHIHSHSLCMCIHARHTFMWTGPLLTSRASRNQVCLPVDFLKFYLQLPSKNAARMLSGEYDIIRGHLLHAVDTIKVLHPWSRSKIRSTTFPGILALRESIWMKWALQLRFSILSGVV